jgi:hypothetical protein
VVTLVGLALSAWLLPAITRQWEDRQKAHELKSGIVADMAAASAPALIGGEANWPGRRLGASAKVRLAQAWSAASLQIEARLRAYFPDHVVQAWQLYSWLMDRWDDSEAGTAEADLLSLTREPIAFEPGAEAAAVRVLVTDRGIRPGQGPILESYVTNRSLEVTALGQVEKALGNKLPPIGPDTMSGRFGPHALEATLFAFEEEIAAEVLSAHANGYSTTAGDLFRDLVP